MKKNYFNIACCFVLLLITNSSINAQVGRLPTQQELDIKANLQQLYISNSYSKAAPTHILTTGPEQNCINAIPVCQQSYSQSNSYTGHGTIQEVNGTCLTTQETNSVWYVFTVQNSGTFTFLLNTPNDYDFALYDITTIGCAGVPAAVPIRCNFSATFGSTGLTLPTAGGNLSFNASQAPTMAGINVTAGQTFALIIDNFSANTNGYNITFGGTAQIFDNTPPTLSNVVLPCNSNFFEVNFSEDVFCNSLASNGSDFIITGPSGPVTVTGALSAECSGGASITNSATVSFNNVGLVTGTYTVSVVNGSDGNTLLDKCGNTMSSTQIATFQYLGALSISATNTLVCVGGATTLSVTIAGGTPPGIVYSWAPVSASTSSITINPNVTNTYFATVTYGGCSATVSQVITIGLPPVVFVNPTNISLCSGTSTITATSTMGGSPCLNCNYTWSGSSTQVNNGVPSSVITGAGAGSYSVTVSSNNGCIGNTAVSNVSIISPSALPSCNIIYASPTGGGSGLIPTSPTDIQTALTLAACNSVIIKMLVGDYTINAPLSLSSFVTLEGGYDVGFPTKTSSKATVGGFPAQGTRIIRSTLNVEGTAGNLRYTGINVNSTSSYFRLQDIRVDMPDNIAGSAISNYGIYLGAGCNNYNITRCYVYSGNAGSGINGAPAATAVNGAVGNIGSNAGVGYSSPMGNSGAGGTGGGATGGAGGAVKIFGGSGAGTIGNNGSAPSTAQGGGGGASGGTGGRGSGNAVAGGKGGNGFSGIVGGNGGVGSTINSSSGCGYSASMVGSNGPIGTNGAAGSPAGSLGVGSDASGYWNTASGTVGTFGSGGAGGGAGGGGATGYNQNTTAGCGGSYGTGAGGGGGGGGGQGGFGGNGGTGGGSTYGIFIFNNGVNGNVVDCQIVNGVAGAGGIGSAGSAGGIGGNGGAGGLGFSTISVNAGGGGAGGKGGDGGSGAAGGNGATGLAVAVKLVGGSALALNTAINMLTQPIITVENKACINVPVSHATAAGGPTWSSFGSSAVPASGAGSPISTVYSTLGRKTVVMNANNYTDFNNIITNVPSTGSIIASASSICPGSVNFASSVAGTAGFNYTWSVLPAGATISSASTSSTSVLFTNTGSTPITYTVTLTINSNCCGLLTPLTKTIVVNPVPANPVGIVNVACVGGVATFSATSPVGSNFGWYSTASGGTLLGSGTTYSVGNVLIPTTVYLQATNSAGCTSSVIPVVVTPTAVPAPVVIPGSACDIGMVQVGINSVAGATGYNWYSNASGTTLVQTGTTLNYSQNISTLGGVYTVYVQTNIIGCNPSPLVPVSGSVTNTPITLVSTISPNDTVCVNSAVTFSLNPGGGNGSFTYTWSPFTSNSNTTTQTFTASTSVNVFISSNGCTKQFLLPIIIAPYPKDTITPHANITCVTSSLTLNGSFSSSGPTYTYSWTTVGGNILTSTTANTVNVNSAGVYILSVNDLITGCTSTLATTVLLNNIPPIVSITTPSVISCITPTVSLLGIATPTTSTYNYTWTTTGGNIASGINSATATTGTAGVYTLFVLDPISSCTSISTTTVTGSSSPPVFTSTISNFPCGAVTTTLAATSTNTNVTFTWVGPNSTSIISGSNTPNPLVGDIGSYSVIATDAVTGCTNSASGAVNNGTINAAFAANPTSGIVPLTVNFTDQSSGAITYNWNFGDSNFSSTTNPVNTFTTNGTYVVTLIVTAGPCSDTATTTIIVESGLSLEIPNVFTPNNDGTNDFFTIKSSGVKEITLQVFNRWGEKLYDFAGAKAAWDGLTGQGGVVPDGTYFYFVKATGFDDKQIEKNGTVNLFR